MVAERVGFSLPKRFERVCDRVTCRIWADCGRLIGTGDWHNDELLRIDGKTKVKKDSRPWWASFRLCFFISPTSLSNRKLRLPEWHDTPFPSPPDSALNHHLFHSLYTIVEGSEAVGVIPGSQMGDFDQHWLPRH
jgi:hypothetical protein